MVIINPGSKKKAIWNFSVRDTHTMSKCAVLTPVCRLVEISFLGGGGRKSQQGKHFCPHVTIVCFYNNWRHRKRKRNCSCFPSRRNPLPPRQPFAVVCFDMPWMQGFNPRSERSGPTTQSQSIPHLKSLKLLQLEYAENSTSGTGRARF